VVAGTRRSGGIVDLPHEVGFERVSTPAVPAGMEDGDGLG
jgi:hypothetical protein